jgi:hypothetical protein
MAKNQLTTLLIETGEHLKLKLKHKFQMFERCVIIVNVVDI